MTRAGRAARSRTTGPRDGVGPHGERPTTRFVSTELGHLAYQAVGSGDRDSMFITVALRRAAGEWRLYELDQVR